jgi:hypothetical protein
MITYKMSESNNNVEMNVAEVESAEVKEVKLNEVGVTVTLEFLVNVRNILDVCTTRSVWKSNELSTIGRLYDGINEVIKNKVAEASAEASTEASVTVLPSVPE